MANLIGAISTKGPANIDARIKDKVLLAANSPISEKIAQCIGTSLWAVAEQLEIDGLLDNLTTVTCIFTRDGKTSIKLDPKELGIYMRIIVYPMEKWNSFKRSPNEQLLIYMILIEELAHHFWNIEDEVEVNYKVISIMKHIFPDIKMSDVYSL